MSFKSNTKLLSEIVTPRRKKVSPADFPKLPYVGLEHVEAHSTRLIGTGNAAEMKSAANHFMPGDVLYSRLRPYLNKVWKADREGLCSAEFIVMPGNADIDADFLRYRLNAQDFVSFANQLNAGDRPRVDFDGIGEFETWLPSSLAEQREIVATIETQLTLLDAGIVALKRVQSNLKRYRASVLKAACEGRLVETEAALAKRAGRGYESGEQLLKTVNEEPDPSNQPRRAGRMWGAGHVPELSDSEEKSLPKGWVWTKVSSIGFDPEGTVQVGPMSMKSSEFSDGGVPVLNVGCVKWGHFSESKLDFLPEEKAKSFNRYRIKSGDVLFTRSGTVGRCAVAQVHQEGWLMTFHLLRVRPNPKKCISEYLQAVFEGAPHIRRQTREASVGSTRAGFNTNLLANLTIPLPPLAEQRRILSAMDENLSKAKQIEEDVSKSLIKIVRFKKAILHKAFA